MFALKLTEKLIIEGISMTYGSKHTDSAVEYKNQPPHPSRCDRYLRIPDLLRNQFMIPKQLGRSGSNEPIRSDHPLPHTTSKASTASQTDSNTSVHPHHTKNSQLKENKKTNYHKKSSTVSIITPNSLITIIAPTGLTLYLLPKSSFLPKLQTRHTPSAETPRPQSMHGSNETQTRHTTQQTTHSTQHQTSNMSTWLKATKQKNKNRRNERNQNSRPSRPGGNKRHKQSEPKIVYTPEDLQCINVKTDALCEDLHIPQTKYRRSILGQDFLIPRKLYDLCLALKEHPTTAPERFMHTLITLTDQAMTSFPNKAHAIALSWPYYDTTITDIENYPIAVIVLQQIAKYPWILTHAFLDDENNDKAFTNNTPVLSPCPICHCGTAVFRQQLDLKLQSPQSDVFVKNNHTFDAFTKLIPSRSWKTHMTDPGYDRTQFEFWSPESRLINSGIHDFLFHLNRLLQPQVDHLLANLKTPLTATERNELEGITNDSDDEDDDKIIAIPNDTDLAQAAIEQANANQAIADSKSGEP